MPVSISGTNGVTFPDSSLQAAAASPYVLKNRIINGAMVIDQRNAGASVTNVAGGSGLYTLDRWATYGNQASKFTVQQNAGSVTPPTGYKNYAGITSSSAYSVISTDEFDFYQAIEGFNIADLGWGAVGAQSVTLSFWVRSSLTGTFGGAINNNSNYSYPFTYTISSANTWTQISITIPGPTAGTWATNNSLGILVNFSMGAGSTKSGTAGAWSANYYSSATGATSVVGTNGATWYVTGTQLEIGTSATPFERRMYGTEFSLCQRYYQNFYPTVFAPGGGFKLWDSYTMVFFPPMRATPSVGSRVGTPSYNFTAAGGMGTMSSSSGWVNWQNTGADNTWYDKSINFNGVYFPLSIEL